MAVLTKQQYLEWYSLAGANFCSSKSCLMASLARELNLHVIENYYLHIDLKFFGDDGRSQIRFLGNDVLLKFVPDGFSPEHGVIQLVLGFSF